MKLVINALDLIGFLVENANAPAEWPYSRPDSDSLLGSLNRKTDSLNV
jgi:hypothetical protein